LLRNWSLVRDMKWWLRRRRPMCQWKQC
jgi:hypothetical protein